MEGRDGIRSGFLERAGWREAAVADPAFDGHEDVIHFSDPRSGLQAWVAIHSTLLGPAIGGCRMHPYRDRALAVRDALRLSRAMTWKNALLGLPFGGGKMVVVGDPARDKTGELMRSLAAAIDSLGGRYIGADDVGTSVRDMDVLRTMTPHVAGLPAADGNACPATAYGVYQAMCAAWRHLTGQPGLAGARVALQGVGNVGMRLARYLHEAGATLLVADVVEERVRLACEQFGATAVPPASILAADADIVSPCALGGVLDAATVDALRCRAVVGAANNQLAHAGIAARLHARGICYVPDFAANAGGMIDLAAEGAAYSCEHVLRRCEQLHDVVLDLLVRASAQDCPPELVANQRVAERLLAAARRRAEGAA